MHHHPTDRGKKIKDFGIVKLEIIVDTVLVLTEKNLLTLLKRTTMGYWEPHTANTAYCEEKYSHSHYIAEFHNT